LEGGGGTFRTKKGKAGRSRGISEKKKRGVLKREKRLRIIPIGIRVLIARQHPPSKNTKEKERQKKSGTQKQERKKGKKRKENSGGIEKGHRATNPERRLNYNAGFRLTGVTQNLRGKRWSRQDNRRKKGRYHYKVGDLYLGHRRRAGGFWRGMQWRSCGIGGENAKKKKRKGPGQLLQTQRAHAKRNFRFDNVRHEGKSCNSLKRVFQRVGKWKTFRCEGERKGLWKGGFLKMIADRGRTRARPENGAQKG